MYADKPVLAFNTKFSLHLINAISILKIITLVLYVSFPFFETRFLTLYYSIGITGLVVLGGHTSVPDPKANFRNAFEGTDHSAYGITNSLVKVMYAYQGYSNAFNVVNEVKVSITAQCVHCLI